MIDDVEIRGITEAEFPEFRMAVGFGFGEEQVDTPEALAAWQALFPIETCLAAVDKGRYVGTFGSFAFDLSVPGGATLPMGGTTIVTVFPSHRRQGLLSKMMARHLDQAVELGQPIAGLWASESSIYRRFGYGIASRSFEVEFRSDAIVLPSGPESIRCRFVDLADAEALLRPVYAHQALTVPGTLSRSDAWWEHRILGDLPENREGMSKRRIVVAEDDGGVRGYVLYRQKANWSTKTSSGKVAIDELIAVDDDARRALWSFMANVDLFPKVGWWNAPVDEPVLIEANEPRLFAASLVDGLWLRILDVKRTLEARQWSTDGRLVLDVVDDTRDDGGRWELTVVDGRATCAASSDEADVTLGIAELGALYLGGTSAVRLHRAGRISGSAEAVVLLDRMAWWPRAPLCSHMF